MQRTSEVNSEMAVSLPESMSTFRITPKGPFSLEASTRFLEGFTPAAHKHSSSDHLHIAFPLDSTWKPAGVCLRQTGAVVVGEVYGEADAKTVRKQVARILSLDTDGSSFPSVGERDPVVGGLQRTYPGLRPVLFWSPYEAAAWTIIGHRIRMSQAAAVKQRMAESLGAKVDVDGDVMHTFPTPNQLKEVSGFPGLFERKVHQLHAVADAALDGQLDAEPLRSAERSEALQRLKQIPGIGDFSAELILIRGAGDPDHFPSKEPRVQRAMADAYGFDDIPPMETLLEIADQWHPFCSWVTLLLRAAAARGTTD